MEKLYSLKACLKMAGGGMHSPHTPWGHQVLHKFTGRGVRHNRSPSGSVPKSHTCQAAYKQLRP